MAMISTIKSFLRLNSTALIDEVDNIQYTSSSTAVIEEQDDRDSLHMQSGQTISRSLSVSITTEFSIGFWLYSVNPGRVVNPSTGNIVSLRMPIIEITNAGNPYVLIWEHTEENGANRLNIQVSDQISTFYGKTPEFTVGQWHYMWVQFAGTTPVVYIDGENQTLEDTSGSAPASLGLSSETVVINGEELGSAFDIVSNTGWIADFLIMNDNPDSEGSSQRIINYGVDYLIDDDDTDAFITSLGFVSDDPTDVTVSAVLSEGSDLYLARTDGRLMKGSNLLWEKRHNFSNIDEENVMILSWEHASELLYVFEKGYLTIASAGFKV